MISTDIEKYRSFSIDNLPLFYQPFWLDIVAKNSWEIKYIEEQGKLIGIMPLVWGESNPQNILMPILTPFLGPYILPEVLKKKPAAKNSKIHKVLNEFLESLPNYKYYEQRWHPSSDMWLPFYWSKFDQLTKYTYILEVKDTEVVWGNLRSNIRTDIKKANTLLEFSVSDKPEDIISMMEKTFKRQNMDFPYDKSVLNEMVNQCCARNKGCIYKATDKEGNVHSAAFVVWDKEQAYYLLSGSDPQFRNSGSMSFLLWEIILETSKFIDKFDFEGSAIPSIERFFRAFGGDPVPYFQITKTESKLMKVKQSVKATVKSLGS